MSNGSDSHTILELLKLTEKYFSEKGLASPRVDAEVLLAHVIGCKRFELYMRFDQPLKEEELDLYRSLVAKRASGNPLQHLTGEQDFYNLTVQVSDKVLVPRPETEILVEIALSKIGFDTENQPARVLDVGTGSGAIPLALAKLWERTEFWAVDLSLDALDVAGGNVNFHGFQDRIHLLHGDLFEPLDELDRFELIVSNPPYVASDDIAGLAPEVRDHEPLLALDGGSDGLAVIRRLVEGCTRHLLPGGWLVMEIGLGQGEEIQGILEAAELFDSTKLLPDLTNRDRIVAAHRSL